MAKIASIKEDEAALTILCFLGWDEYLGIKKLAKYIPMTAKRLYSILSKWRKYKAFDNTGLTDSGMEWAYVVSRIEHINNRLSKVKAISDSIYSGLGIEKEGDIGFRERTHEFLKNKGW